MEKIITCILIDDDQDDHEIFRMVISETLLPVQCTFFENCDQAVDYILARPYYVPQFIFIDWFLTTSDGLTCMDSLRQIPRLSGCQYIIQSGIISPDGLPQSNDLRQYKFLQKSDSIASAAQKLKTLLSSPENTY